MDHRDFSPEDRKAIREELGRILSSPSFRNSGKCAGFLRFVVERTLAGEAETLKERTIAVEYFGKSHDADLDRDSTVRVCALNTRRRLAEYYAAAAPGRFRIELPAGRYVPAFQPARPEMAQEPVPERPGGGAAPQRRRPWGAMAAGTLVVLAAATLTLLPRKPSSEALMRFWGPALAAPGGVELLLAAPLEQLRPDLPAGGGASPAARSDDASQATAVAEILHFLRSRGAQARIGDYRQIREEEVPGRAVVIVGASVFRGPHSWLSGCPVRLRADETPPHFSSNSGKEWPPAGAASDAFYAAIYRIPAEKRRPFILLIAGLNARASEMAASYLVEGGRLASLLQDAPAGWEGARMVLLLEIRKGIVRPVSALLW